jgi:hypothetical protein
MLESRGLAGRGAVARLVLLVAASSATGLFLASSAPAAPDGLSRALAQGRLTKAEHALERALALADPARARRLFGSVARPDPREGMPILRELAARSGELPPAKRAQAERILARPTDRNDAIHGYRTRAARRVCGARICIWWVTRTSDAPALRDRNRNRIPDYVDTARIVFRDVWATEVGRFGYRRPLSDRRSRNHGPNTKLDVYLADVGAKGLYGYCTTDDPGRARRKSVSSYCVVDDDFSRRQFGGSATGVRALKVTAAHEFFHAVQYAYDWLEDLWLMEGTAAWVEDEVYDAINDNRQYLRTSPLAPRFHFKAVDYYHPDPADVESNFKYGAWIFWRYLSEQYGRDVIRSVWRRADAWRGMPDEYSAEALVSALRLRRLDFATVFSAFGMANIAPARSYEEGAAYPVPQPTTTAVGPGGVGETPVLMEHLSNDLYAFTPEDLPPSSRLTITLKLPHADSRPGASALVEAPDGAVTQLPAVFDPVALRWTIDVPAFETTRRVVLVLTNASTRYTCWRRQVFSCQGRPVDDHYFYFQAEVTSAPAP